MSTADRAAAVSEREALRAYPRLDHRQRGRADHGGTGRTAASFHLAAGPSRYVTGEETAVVQFLARGWRSPPSCPPALSAWSARAPDPDQNPEALCQLALIARFGSEWFRELGSHADPGSALVTISGAVRDPGVYERAFGRR